MDGDTFIIEVRLGFIKDAPKEMRNIVNWSS